MKITGFNNRKDEFYVTLQKSELEILLGKSMHYSTDIESIVGSELKNLISIFEENKSAINDLNYNKSRIINLIKTMEKDMNRISFLIPEKTKDLK